MLPTNFDGIYPHLKYKQADFFKRKRQEIFASKKNMTILPKTNYEKDLKPSYQISFRVARVNESYTIVKTLINFFTITLSNVCLMKNC